MSFAAKSSTASDTLFSAIDEIQKNIKIAERVVNPSKTASIVDVISFCNDPHYLNLRNNGLKLYLAQNIMLKTFYMGTFGNENVKLTQEEWDWLNKQQEHEDVDGIVYENNIKDVIKRIHARERGESKSEYFSLLHLVLGRRSGKTLLASIITVYEAYKVLVINDGDPHGYFNLPNDDEIAIINVALSKEQAGRLFYQIGARIRNAPFFKGRVAKETTTEIRLYTDSDLRKKQEGSNISINGSVLLLCGHSNPDSLAGYSAILILFDEIAFFDDKGQVTGSYFFGRLTPSLAKFYKYNSARVVMISSPNARNGVFYDHYKQAKEEDSILSYQLSTWNVNPEVPYNNAELSRYRKQNESLFTVEYGAQFSAGGAMGNYFEEGLIDRCIRGDLNPHVRPMPRFNYHLHVDPSKGINNYSAVLIAKEKYLAPGGKWRNRMYLAGAWVWRPSPGMGLDFSAIDQKVLQICGLFRPVQVTYDDFQSAHSMQLLRSAGFNVRLLSYNRSVKQQIYQNLKQLMIWQPEPELYLYDDGGEASLLIAELRNLKYKKVQRGITLVVDKNSETSSDDLSDALAGACAAGNETFKQDLPRPQTVRAGW